MKKKLHKMNRQNDGQWINYLTTTLENQGIDWIREYTIKSEKITEQMVKKGKACVLS